MEQILSVFGIDWRLLLINSINFGILLVALWYFMYGPVTRMLEERRRKIAEGVEHAEEASRRLEEIAQSRTEVLSQATQEADAMLSRARVSGEAKEKELITAGENAAARILKDAEHQADEAKKQAIAESKQEVAKLIVLGMERVLQEKK